MQCVMSPFCEFPPQGLLPQQRIKISIGEMICIAEHYVMAKQSMNHLPQFCRQCFFTKFLGIRNVDFQFSKNIQECSFRAQMMHRKPYDILIRVPHDPLSKSVSSPLSQCLASPFHAQDQCEPYSKANYLCWIEVRRGGQVKVAF
jgi:hypothetical protein